MNQEVLMQVDNIVDIIKNSLEYKDYKLLYEKLKKNEKANSLINQVKSIQKEIVKRKSLGEDVDNLEKQLSDCLKQLDRIPLYTEFVDKQKELDDIYQLIKQKLDNYFYEKLN